MEGILSKEESVSDETQPSVSLKDIAEETAVPSAQLHVPSFRTVTVAGKQVQVPGFTLRTMRAMSKAARSVLGQFIAWQAESAKKDFMSYADLGVLACDVLAGEEFPQFIADLSGLAVDDIVDADMREVQAFLEAWVDECGMEELVGNFTRLFSRASAAWKKASEIASESSPPNSSTSTQDTD